MHSAKLMKHGTLDSPPKNNVYGKRNNEKYNKYYGRDGSTIIAVIAAAT